MLGSPERRSEVNLALGSENGISGRVTAFDDSGLGGVLVQVLRADATPRAEGSLTTPGLVNTQVTDGRGAYRFRHLRPDRDYQVRIHLPDRRHFYGQGQSLRVGSHKFVTADIQVRPLFKGRWKGYSMANGLPRDGIWDLEFAPDELLWLATGKGVSAFDGRKFENYSIA